MADLFIKSFVIGIVVIIVGCKTDNSSTDEKESFNKLKKQYLLTNLISIKKRNITYGASSYLIRYKNKIYLATAKHLTRYEMGFEPALNLKTYKDSVNYWKAFPRNNQLSNDTIYTSDLYFFDDDGDGYILLGVKNKPTNLGVLTPNFKQLKKGSKVKILGCEYEDNDCFQNEFYGTLNNYTIMDQIEIFMDSTNISFAGFSGAPVLDMNNNVIGHILGGAMCSDGNFKVYAAPITLIKKIIK